MEHVEVDIFDGQLQDISNLLAFDGSAWHAFRLCLYQMYDKYFLAICCLKDKIEQFISEIHISLEFCLFLFAHVAIPVGLNPN